MYHKIRIRELNKNNFGRNNQQNFSILGSSLTQIQTHMKENYKTMDNWLDTQERVYCHCDYMLVHVAKS